MPQLLFFAYGLKLNAESTQTVVLRIDATAVTGCNPWTEDVFFHLLPLLSRFRALSTEKRSDTIILPHNIVLRFFGDKGGPGRLVRLSIYMNR